MTSVVVVFPKIEDAKGIKNLLVRRGFSVNAACTTGAQAISQMEDLGSGVVISAYKLADMMYSELNEYLPKGFEMLLLASAKHLNEVESKDILCLSMPLKTNDLISTVEMMVTNIERRRRKLREKPKERNEKELELIKEAKRLLMDRNHMTEPEAHKYLQKCSMDSSTNMVESAQMVLAMMKM